MIGKRGLGGFEHTLNAGQGKVVAGLLRVIAQRQVGDGKLHLLRQLQQNPGGNAVLGADVRVDEGVGLYPVNIAQEEAKHLLGKGPVLLDDKRLQQFVQIAQVHGEGGDGGNMAVENLQHVQRLQQILRRLQLQKFAALLKQQRIIRADIAGTIGHDALVQVAERALSFGFIIGIGITQAVIGALPQTGQRQQLLLIGQGRVLNNIQSVRQKKLLLKTMFYGILANRYYFTLIFSPCQSHNRR